jgi:two-component system, NarL family, sensor kinase
LGNRLKAAPPELDLLTKAQSNLSDTAKREQAMETDQRHRELGILNAIARDLNGSVDLKQALSAVLGRVAELFGLRTGWIWLLHEAEVHEGEERDGDGEHYLAAAQNLPPALERNPERLEGWCYCIDTFRKDDMQGAANINVIACSRLKGLVEGTDGLHCHASVPLRAHGKKLGLLNVADAQWRRLSEEDLRLLQTVGDLLGIAIERARLYERSAALGAVEERYRLARELHDTLGQGLAGILLRLEALDAALESGTEAGRLRGELQRVMQLTRNNIEEARRSVLDLRAAPLEGRSLAEALEALAAEAAERGGFSVEFCAVGGQPLPVRLEAGVYRIAQEALTNIARHAGAKEVEVDLELKPGRVRLEVADDGCGFDPGQTGGDHFGLVGLSERARLLDGRLSIESTPGQGTRLLLEIERRDDDTD